MSEVILFIAVLLVPAAVGYLIARRCVRHRLAFVVALFAFAAFLFVSSVPYAAFSATFIVTITASVGYFVGRLLAPQRLNPNDRNA